MSASLATCWKTLAIAVALMMVLLTLGTITTGRGQPPERVQRGAAAPALTRSFFSLEACSRCHRPDSNTKSLPNQLVRFDECQVWAERDKHSRAFDALTGPRGQQLGKLLGFKNAASERACLSCHASGFLRSDLPPEDSGAESAKSEGVSCAACHGPYEEWVGKHGILAAKNRAWREKTAQEKSREYGMTDLRDPATRASVCSSCHVGNAGERQVVTHAMYAAGHPPLPAFDAATYLDAMPAHWWNPAEVDAFKKEPELARRNHADPSEPPLTKAAVIGGVVTLREAMRLLAAEAEAADPGGQTRWPAYGQLECYACHHDLRSPGYLQWRQQRGSGSRFDGFPLTGTAGQPQFRPWPLALVPLALAQAENAESSERSRQAVRDGVKALHEAFEAQPFGDGGEVARASKRVEAAAESLLHALESTRFTRTSARRLLTALATVAADDFPDFDSARQVACAIRTIHAEWQPRPANDAKIVEVIDEVGSPGTELEFAL